MEDTLTLAEAIDDLVSAEDFLDYFEVPYDPAVVQVNRLHILQRFHDYLARQAPNLPPEEGARRALARAGAEGVKADRFDSESQSFHKKVREGFLALAKAEPERFRIFDARLPEGELHTQIRKALRDGFGIL